MFGFSEVFGGFGDIREIINQILAILMIPMLINCFLGYKIQKFLITLGGVISGALIGLLIGILCQNEVVAVLIILLSAVGCGFLAYKVYKLGVFIYHWQLGTLLFIVLFLYVGVYNLIVTAPFFGIFVGILAVILNKWYIIISTAFSGGMVAGKALAFILELSLMGFVFGLFISIMGIVVQCLLEKETKSALSNLNKKNNETNINQAYVPLPTNTALSSPLQYNRVEAIAVSKYTEISKINPDYYCPKSKVLIDSIVLSKDNMKSVYAYIDFNNIGTDNLIAVYFQVIGYDIAGDKLGEQNYSVIDINVKPATRFNSGSIELFDKAIRKVDVVITKIVKDNYEVEKFEDSDTIKLPELVAIADTINSDIAEIIDIKSDEKYLYTPLEDGLWVCTCGHIGYEYCSYCRRTSDQMLKNTDEDVIRRIHDNISEIDTKIDKCNLISELNVHKKKLERISAILARNEFNDDLLASCESVVNNIQEKNSKLKMRDSAVLDKSKKVALFAVAAVVTLFLIIVIGKAIIGLPPSDNTIKSDVTTYICEKYGENFRIEEIEIEKKQSDDELSTISNVVAVDKKNKDSIKATIYTEYVKCDGRYKVNNIDSTQYEVIPNHKITEQDKLSCPTLSLVAGKETIYINEDSITEYEGFNGLNMNLDILYDEISYNDRTAIVPANISIDYLNSIVSEKIEIEYIYRGNYCWECNNYVDLRLSPKDNSLDVSMMKQLISNSTFKYEDEDLACQYLTFNSYDTAFVEGFTKAELTSKVDWVNSYYKLSGVLKVEYEYLNNTWKVSDIQLVNASEPQKYGSISDEEIFTIINGIIPLECTQKTNISDINIFKKEVNENALTVFVEYNSEKDNFKLLNSVKISLKDSLAKGYKFDSLLSEHVSGSWIKEEIHEDVVNNYTLSSTETTPIGVSKNGTANLQLDIDNDCRVSLKGYIGSMYLDLSGYIDYNTNELILKNNKREIYVNYTLLINCDEYIEYTVNSNLSYSGGVLKGVIEFDTVAIGVDDFSISIE